LTWHELFGATSCDSAAEDCQLDNRCILHVSRDILNCTMMQLVNCDPSMLCMHAFQTGRTLPAGVNTSSHSSSFVLFARACSTVLPVPYAFSKLGILPGVMTMAVVAFVNDCTCCFLVGSIE
jgi:hypothetical protein